MCSELRVSGYHHNQSRLRLRRLSSQEKAQKLYKVINFPANERPTVSESGARKQSQEQPNFDEGLLFRSTAVTAKCLCKTVAPG